MMKHPYQQAATSEQSYLPSTPISQSSNHSRSPSVESTADIIIWNDPNSGNVTENSADKNTDDSSPPPLMHEHAAYYPGYNSKRVPLADISAIYSSPPPVWHQQDVFRQAYDSQRARSAYMSSLYTEDYPRSDYWSLSYESRYGLTALSEARALPEQPQKAHQGAPPKAYHALSSNMVGNAGHRVNPYQEAHRVPMDYSSVYNVPRSGYYHTYPSQHAQPQPYNRVPTATASLVPNTASYAAKGQLPPISHYKAEGLSAFMKASQHKAEGLAALTKASSQHKAEGLSAFTRASQHIQPLPYNREPMPAPSVQPINSEHVTIRRHPGLTSHYMASSSAFFTNSSRHGCSSRVDDDIFKPTPTERMQPSNLFYNKYPAHLNTHKTTCQHYHPPPLQQRPVNLQMSRLVPRDMYSRMRWRRGRLSSSPTPETRGKMNWEAWLRQEAASERTRKSKAGREVRRAKEMMRKKRKRGDCEDDEDDDDDDDVIFLGVKRVRSLNWV